MHPFLIQVGGASEEVAEVKNMKIPGPGGDIPIRIYYPKGNGPFPVLVLIHGGGWFVGNLDTNDKISRSLTNRTPCMVVSVDYRLAPEHKFPAVAQDAYEATKWVADNASRINGDQSRIAVCGDSAGGNLAAVVCLMAKDKGHPSIAYQVLIYPILDVSSFDRDSYQEYGEGYLVSLDGMKFSKDSYIRREEDVLDPYVSPLLASDLSGLPPTLILNAEFDVLKDEGIAYANRLKQAGVEVTHANYDTMTHGFFTMAAMFDKANDAINEVATALHEVFTK